ncbi:Zn-dependent hydrolase [Nitratireductor sp. ZSWI3]|uniref:Zn-dependent hydrolase n=1 Tax=Nitratireductor sp. ZSWI3 TaxID=2966359 RepID=UPI0021503BB5|nr:Zn-dependent hydrolase [Nitratireductor sp. ZSWI3]MCR4265880.1 Zn-dependent hydrolase [Nitratireductor sp. ZSWI3]
MVQPFIMINFPTAPTGRSKFLQVLEIEAEDVSGQNPRINSERLKALLDGVNAYGHNSRTGGFNRIGYSEPDMAVRAWFVEQMRGDGLAVSRDGVANIFGRFGPVQGPSILVGSHLDTVPEGGSLDGALGVCVALECVRAMREAGVEPATAVEVVATAEEEGRFGGMLGSQAIAGVLTAEQIDAAVDADGVRLVEAMRARGLDARDGLAAARAPGSVRAFLELHIEQGPVLEHAGIPIGIAHTVAGVVNLSVRLDGVANHSGTTPMHLRADAFAGAAAIAHAVPQLLERHGGENSRITIGKVDIHPNFIHTVPGRAEFVVNIRDTDDRRMAALAGAMREVVADVAAARGLRWTIEEQSRMAPVELDAGLAALLHEEADRLGLQVLDMPSGAGHDAQTMQSLCPSALLFVPSRGGISHAPEEWTAWGDIEKGAALMLAALVRLVERS